MDVIGTSWIHDINTLDHVFEDPKSRDFGPLKSGDFGTPQNWWILGYPEIGQFRPPPEITGFGVVLDPFESVVLHLNSVVDRKRPSNHVLNRYK